MTAHAGSEITALLSADLFKALSDPNRLAILASLAEGNRRQTVTEVAERCPVDISVVSRHLKILRDVNVLEAERRGKEVLYRVRVDHLVDLLRGLATALEACCRGVECGISDQTGDGEAS